MSETPQNDPETSTSPPPEDEEQKTPQSTNKDNGSVVATKQIRDVIEFQQPSSSKNYSFKTEIRINILKDSDGSTSTLNLLNSGKESAIKKDIMEEDSSFITVENCVKEKTTNTAGGIVMFSRNERTQRAITGNEAPPPYESHPPPSYFPNTSRRPIQDPHRGGYTTRDGAVGGADYPLDYDDDSFFMETLIRHFFVKKVFCILTIQLLITTGLILLAMFHKPTKHFMATNLPMILVMSFIFFAMYFVLICYQTTRRIFPLNFLLLALLTISLAYICAAGTVFYSTKIILVTAASTALICFIVTLLACQTYFDITKWGFILSLASLVMMIFGLIVMIIVIITHSKVLWLVYAGLITTLFCVYLLYDMQCILGGRRQELSPEEYIYAALTLYVDIVMIFMYMLQLVGACSR